jgi:hypothetical protein
VDAAPGAGGLNITHFCNEMCVLSGSLGYYSRFCHRAPAPVPPPSLYVYFTHFVRAVSLNSASIADLLFNKARAGARTGKEIPAQEPLGVG